MSPIPTSPPANRLPHVTTPLTTTRSPHRPECNKRRGRISARGPPLRLDTKCRFTEAVLITSSRGPREAVVQGAVNTNEFDVVLSVAINACRSRGKYVGICGTPTASGADFGHLFVEVIRRGVKR